jgi:hypothetical protein
MTLDPDIDAHYRLGFEQGRLSHFMAVGRAP